MMTTAPTTASLFSTKTRSTWMASPPEDLASPPEGTAASEASGSPDVSSKISGFEPIPTTRSSSRAELFEAPSLVVPDPRVNNGVEEVSDQRAHHSRERSHERCPQQQ